MGHPKKVFKISDSEIVEMYLSGKSLYDIAKVAQDNVGLMSLRKRLISLGVDTSFNGKRYFNKYSNAARKYIVNHNIFDVIDCEEKAYWLGFLFADGYNHIGKGCLCLRISKKDCEHLYKFRNFLGSNSPIYEITKTINGITREYVELSIYSKTICSSLQKLGCVEGKTYTIEYPSINKVFDRHFIRGVFDGDGCISIVARNVPKMINKKVFYQFTVVGRKEFLETINDKLYNAVYINKLSLKNAKNNFAWRIHYSGRIVVTKLMSYLYSGSTVYLERKYNKYLQLYLGREIYNNTKSGEFGETPVLDNTEPSSKQ